MYNENILALWCYYERSFLFSTSPFEIEICLNWLLNGRTNGRCLQKCKRGRLFLLWNILFGCWTVYAKSVHSTLRSFTQCVTLSLSLCRYLYSANQLSLCVGARNQMGRRRTKGGQNNDVPLEGAKLCTCVFWFNF